MTMVTILKPDGATTVDGDIDADGVLVAPGELSNVLGWDLKPEGLCRGDVCIPVRDEAELREGDRVDLVAAAGLVGCTVLVDSASNVAAISVAAPLRSEALKGRRAPDFTLPDLDGNLHSLEEFKDRKRLLVAFASW